MALLDEKTREKYLKALGFKSVKEFQKATMYPQWVDGDYGPQTDNALRTAYNVHKYCKNFSPREFMCECGGKYCGGYPDYMKPSELKHIQAIRDHYGKPITVTSGLRCKEWNRQLNGSVENSGHLRGLAIDFYQPGVTDTVTNRKSAMRYFMSLPNHRFTYGANMAGSDGIYRSASYMGNAMHTECYNTDVQPGKLNVDGIGGSQTIMAIQLRFKLKTVDGIISGQNAKYGKYYAALTAVEYGAGGSATVAAIQKWAGYTANGVWDKATSVAVQKKLVSLGYSVGSWGADGFFGADSMKAMQRWLNGEKPGPVPPTPTDYYKMIDVSEFQSSINWASVKAAGIKGVMIRCAGRGGESGKIYDDTKFMEYIKGAHAVGLPVGIYFLTQAITAAEGKAEAQYAIKMWQKAGVPVSYPICIDSENVTWKNSDGTTGYGRANDRNLSRAKRTTAIKAFCDEVKKQGYKAMLYASVTWLENQVDMSKLDCDVWVAQYYSECQYKGKYIIWQYTSEGSVNGVKGVVDMNRCYIKAKAVNPPRKESGVAAWCKKIADSGKYHYVSYSDETYTHQCPICHPRTYDLGWNCIGFAFAAWRHGGGIPCRCSCDTVYNGLCDRWVGMSDAAVLASIKARTGLDDIQLIRNGNRPIPASSLKSGDLLFFYNPDKTYQHMGVYVGDGKIADCTGGRSKNIAYGSYASYNRSMPCLFAIRYTKKKGYPGTLPSYRLKKTNAQVKADAVKWAKWIAGDNSFHYGYGDESHHNGCLFCGTQDMKKGHGIKEYEHTYCCNPFVGAAWAHGGGDATAYKMCHNYNSWDFGMGSGSYEKSPLFDNLGHPDKSKLQAGDVLCNGHHVVLYLGNGQIAEAGHEDDNVVNSSSWKSSIEISALTDSRYKGLPRAYRYNSMVDCDRPISYGEVSDRVVLLQKYMIWGGWLAKGGDDGEFGAKTLSAVKKMQEVLGVTPDGWVGLDTLKAMSAYRR